MVLMSKDPKPSAFAMRLRYHLGRGREKYVLQQRCYRCSGIRFLTFLTFSVALPCVQVKVMVSGSWFDGLKSAERKRDYEAVEEFDGLQNPPRVSSFSPLLSHRT